MIAMIGASNEFKHSQAKLKDKISKQLKNPPIHIIETWFIRHSVAEKLVLDSVLCLACLFLTDFR